MKDSFEMSPTCLTGGYPPHPLRPFPPMMNMGMPSPYHMQWQFRHNILYQNNSPSDRRDSGIHSSNEIMSSSPESDDCDRYIPVPVHESTPIPRYLPGQCQQEDTSRTQTNTPPKCIYPEKEDSNRTQTNTPSRCNYTVKEEHESNHYTENTDTHMETDEKNTTHSENSSINALKNLQMSVEKNLNISSPESLEQHNNNEEDYRVPSLNSHGKIKIVKCKQCKMVFQTKLEFWKHQKTHIKPDRLLQCEMCPFVTEYKHHLEYHIRNHGGEKPFACKECDYKCVNKSMLNSHMKSHSNVYQYRCQSCHYSSKYCHSLKLHLRKYNHQPAMVLNPDGTPNPLPIIDVYGTRRGPKLKSNGDEEQMMSPKKIKTETQEVMPPPPMHTGMLPMHLMENPEIQMRLLMQQAILMQQALRMINQNNPANTPAPEPLAGSSLSPASSPRSSNDEEPRSSSPTDSAFNSGDNTEEVLDLSSKSPKYENSEDGRSSTDEDNDEDQEQLNLLYNFKSDIKVDETTPVPLTPPPESKQQLRCEHCAITFDHPALYTLHMRFHTLNDPFTCNACGEKCLEKVAFTVHIFSRPH